MMFDGKGRPLRLLPWRNEYGAPCYLSADDPTSRMSRLADEVEADLIGSAEYVLTEARRCCPRTRWGRGSCGSWAYDSRNR